MITRPKTKEEAQKIRYDRWAGNPKGVKYVPGFCAEEIYHSTYWHSYQCSRKSGYGPDGLYCKQHAKKFEEKKL